MVFHCIVAISFADKGIDIIVEKRKIHFIKVITEYLVITGLNAPRYNEKANPLMSISIIPKMLLSIPPSALPLFNIKNNIPDRLNSTPPAFLNVIGSLRTKAAMNIVYIGESELIIEQCIGVI